MVVIEFLKMLGQDDALSLYLLMLSIAPLYVRECLCTLRSLRKAGGFFVDPVACLRNHSDKAALSLSGTDEF